MREDLMILEKINEELRSMTEKEIFELNERIEQDIKSEKIQYRLVELFNDKNIIMNGTDEDLNSYPIVQDRNNFSFEKENEAMNVNYNAA